MTDEPLNLDQRLARLERDRLAADRRYNDALTALDRAIGQSVDVPDAPAAADDGNIEARLRDLRERWQTAPAPPPAADRSVKGRLRTFVSRLVGPPFANQQAFNGAVVDHAARTAASADAMRAVVARLVDLTREQADTRARFESHLIQYLQTITWYVDTKDRASAAGAEVLNHALSALTDDWLKRWESLGARETRLGRQAQDLLAAFDDVRSTSALAQQTALSLKRDTERLLAAGVPAVTPGARPTAAPDLDAHRYVSFENEFRGPVDEIRARLSAYVPRFEGRSDVLEIGCGRGEFLELLRDRGVTARGLDINEAMVQETRARGLDAVTADALDYLTGLADASLGGLFAAQVVEHLPPDYLARLIETAGHKVRPGGLIVLETINPTSWVAFFESYIRDLTHVRPLHPDTLQFLVRAGGFQQVTVEFKAPVPDAERLESFPPPAPDGDLARLEGLVEGLNRNVARLNGRLFGCQDYAVIGER